MPSGTASVRNAHCSWRFRSEPSAALGGRCCPMLVIPPEMCMPRSSGSLPRVPIASSAERYFLVARVEGGRLLELHGRACVVLLPELLQSLCIEGSGRFLVPVSGLGFGFDQSADGMGAADVPGRSCREQRLNQVAHVCIRRGQRRGSRAALRARRCRAVAGRRRTGPRRQRRTGSSQRELVRSFPDFRIDLPHLRVKRLRVPGGGLRIAVVLPGEPAPVIGFLRLLHLGIFDVEAGEIGSADVGVAIRTRDDPRLQQVVAVEL